MLDTQVSSTREKLEDAISMGEANMLLEGFNPNDDAVYKSLKADVLAGKIDFDQAVDAAILTATRNRAAAA